MRGLHKIDWWRRWILSFPECALLDTTEQHDEIIAIVRKGLLRGWRYVALMVFWTVTIPRLCIFMAGKLAAYVPFIPRLVLTGCFGALSVVGLVLLMMWLLRRRAERIVRAWMIEQGIPVCMDCGYGLRGQTEPRCPECGRPFDAAMLQGHDGGEDGTHGQPGT